MSNSNYYPWLNPNACQLGKIGLQWKHVAWQLCSICSRESELHPNLLTLSVCLSVRDITFEYLDIETSFLVCGYILTISRSRLSTKVVSRSRSFKVISESNCKCFDFYPEARSCLLTECFLVGTMHVWLP